MRYTFTLLTLFVFFAAALHAQEKSVPDYRTDKESFQKIHNKTMRKELASFTVAGGEEKDAGMIMKEVPLTQMSNAAATFSDDSFKVSIQTGVFEAPKHRLLYYDSSLIKIDNKPFWGTGGHMPLKTIFAVDVYIGQQYVEIPYTAIDDLYEPNLCWTDAKNKGTQCRTGVYVSPDDKRVYITMFNGSGLGQYEVTWIIESGKYLRRVIDYRF